MAEKAHVTADDVIFTRDSCAALASLRAPADAMYTAIEAALPILQKFALEADLEVREPIYAYLIGLQQMAGFLEVIRAMPFTVDETQRDCDAALELPPGIARH